MKIAFSEPKNVVNSIESLREYRTHVRTVVEAGDFTQNESSLGTWNDELMKEGVRRIVDEIGEVAHVILIGIGGSSLGTEAIHSALGGKVALHVLDSVAPSRISELIQILKNVPEDDIAICAISKSGTTTETLTNTEVLLTEMRELYGEKPYNRLVCIGNPDNPLLKSGEEAGAFTLSMHETVGGRYSVFTAVGLVPLALLGHDIDKILTGVSAVLHEENETQAAEGAGMLFEYMKEGTRIVNFFAFDVRLEKLGKWYRQLTAESLGKENTEDGRENTLGFIPVISTPVELHSTGQLFFSGFKNIFTDFVSFAEINSDYTVVSDTKIASMLGGKSMHEIHDAIYGGVIGAYNERHLPYRTTVFENELPYALGLFMGMRMLETMYLAKLMQVDAFNQPNVELYKNITRKLLDV